MSTEFIIDGFDEAFSLFEKLLLDANRKVNLISRFEEPAIRSHINDSLLLHPHLSAATNVFDLGSGGGFPVIPLAITRPDIPFTAIDSSERKADFLRFAAHKLHLQNLEALHGRIEDQTHLHGTFSVVTARALAPLSSLIPLAAPFLLPRPALSTLLFLKGEQYEKEQEEAKDALEHYHLSLESQELAPSIPGRKCSVVLSYVRTQSPCPSDM